MDVWQLGAGRPPSLLPFDSLLLPYPVTPTWRRQIAEAHSMRYVESSAALVKPGESLVDKNCIGDSARCDQESGGREAEEKREGCDHDETHAGTGNMAGNSSRRVARSDGGWPLLNVGFIGHDFDEHPTAHMVEGVFVWQRRLARIRGERDGAVKAVESGETNNSGGRLITSLATPVSDCCR